jgi:DNA-binding NarL/FixJ family response regulator
VQCQLYAGLVAEAVRTAAERHAAVEAAGDAAALATWSQVLGQALLWQGRPRAAARHFGESLAMMKGYDIVGYGIWCQAELAFCLAWTDRRAFAPVTVPALGSHAAFLAPLIQLSLAGRALCLDARAEAEAHATAAAERAAAGEQLLPELLARFFLVRLRATRARTARVAELAAACEGELAGAIAEGARSLARGRGAELESAARRLAQAGLAPLAAEWFLRAADTYRGEGAALACRRSGNAAQQQRGAMEADPPLPAATAQPDALTSREREVAALAAEGLTNQQIAARLHVSVRTVHAHLRTVYEKLGVNERHLLGPLLARSSEPPS